MSKSSYDESDQGKPKYESTDSIPRVPETDFEEAFFVLTDFKLIQFVVSLNISTHNSCVH